MQADHIRQIRSRKLDLYAALLPHGSVPVASDLDDNAQYALVLQEVARLAPAGFGLTVGRHRSLADLGVLGQVTMSCATLGEVLELWKIFSASAGELVFLESDAVDDQPADDWSIFITPYPYLPAGVANLLADELCATFFVLAQEITGHQFSNFKVELNHAAEPGCLYAQAFPGQVVFNAPVTRLVGPAAALQLPVRSAAVGMPSDLTDDVHGDLGDLQRLKPVTRRMHGFFLARRGAPLTLRAAAMALGHSERTLVRRLAEEGTSFCAELDGFRRRYGMALVAQGGLQAKQVAHLVGFASENSLRKAFKKWTGVPIGAWAQRSDS